MYSKLSNYINNDTSISDNNKYIKPKSTIYNVANPYIKKSEYSTSINQITTTQDEKILVHIK